MSLVKINNLYLRSGSRNLLNDIHLEIQKGEIVLLVGLPGSGKSLLIKILAGIIKKYQGEMLWAEPFHKKRIGFVPKIRSRLRLIYSGKELAQEYFFVNKPERAGEYLMDAVKIFSHFDSIELLRKNIAEMSLLEQRILMMLLVLSLSPELILLEQVVESDQNFPMDFLRGYLSYCQKNDIALVMEFRISDIRNVEYDRLILLHKGWSVFSGRRDQIEKKLNEYIIRIQPSDLEEYFRGMDWIDHKTFSSEEDAMDLILREGVDIKHIMAQLVQMNIPFRSMEIFKPSLRQLLRYKLEEFNIVE